MAATAAAARTSSTAGASLHRRKALRRRRRKLQYCQTVAIVLLSTYIALLWHLQGTIIHLEGYQISIGSSKSNTNSNIDSGIGSGNDRGKTDSLSTLLQHRDARARVVHPSLPPGHARNDSPRHNIYSRQSCVLSNNDTYEGVAAPDLIIAGTQKSGTTPVRAWLNQHPNIVGSLLFEQHFFDHYYLRLMQQARQQYGSNVTSKATDPALLDQQLHCNLRRQYIDNLQVAGRVQNRAHRQTAATGGGGRIVSFEKTPAYLLWPHIPVAVLKTCPWMPRIIVVVRNPVDRLYSQYCMEYSRASGRYPTLEALLDAELALLRRHGLSRAPAVSNITTLAQRSDAATRRGWFSISHITPQHRNWKDDIRNRDLRDPAAAYHRLLQRDMYAPQLQRWYDAFDASKILVVFHEDLRQTEAAWTVLQDFAGVPHVPLDAAVSHAEYRPKRNFGNASTAIAAPLRSATRTYLQAFYEPYNKALSLLLHRSLDWQ